jgi:hypothetical protein
MKLTGKKIRGILFQKEKEKFSGFNDDAGNPRQVIIILGEHQAGNFDPALKKKIYR